MHGASTPGSARQTLAPLPPTGSRRAAPRPARTLASERTRGGVKQACCGVGAGGEALPLGGAGVVRLGLLLPLDVGQEDLQLGGSWGQRKPSLAHRVGGGVQLTTQSRRSAPVRIAALQMEPGSACGSAREKCRGQRLSQPIM